MSDALDDFWVVQAKRAGDLANAPEFSEIVVAEGGNGQNDHDSSFNIRQL